MASINDLATAATAVSALSPPAADQQQQPPPPRAASTDAPAAADSAVVRGALVVLEGLDRSGKTTQVKLLEQRFVELGRRVKVMRFPGRSMALLGLVLVLVRVGTLLGLLCAARGFGFWGLGIGSLALR